MAETSDNPPVGEQVSGNVSVASEKQQSESSWKNASADQSTINGASPAYRLFNRQRTIHEVLGGGIAADAMLWKRKGLSIGILVAASAAWYLFEHSGYTFLSLIATILLLLVAILFIWANAATVLNRPPPPLPELELSEEMVNDIAASMRVRINNALAVAHDIAIGKDIKLFFKVVVFLWLFSVFGNCFNFLTLVYISFILSFTVPALYNKYEEHIDRGIAIAHKQVTKQYRSLDESLLSKIPKGLPKQKSN
eukprot:TRINITY_DN4611_c0_g1_i2.p1 TRINITY_DN4611_c0_g1~~TRINITY_DN4611_c0_g1_i2.p1  ORF type:complete len:252 (+),score=42.54 TRINITY_DN4611_c0_g1_i2:221-976(+)